MHPIMRTAGYAALALGCAWAADAPAAADGEAARLDFNLHIRPLLADRCFACHGPDENSRKARLRLDRREGALAVNRSGRPIVQPGDPAASELIRRIDTADPEDLMPPPESKLALSAVEKEWLRRWVAQGAEYQTHWSFVPPPRWCRRMRQRPPGGGTRSTPLCWSACGGKGSSLHPRPTARR
ncbi:MAG: hypothetical protein M5U12_16150 [Verrucomicrobia bacterium]|nr:hypothetical protein [Verrucomicrobiota bacterium]